PPHCVAGSEGARFAPGLALPPSTVVVSKDTLPEQDTYSGFQGGDLDAHLREVGVRRVFVGGLATDYCVFHTVKDALARGYAAGLGRALEYLATLRFTAEELAWVAREGRFDPAFVDYLARLRFTGDVHALPEGTVFFADEPILRVTAPLPEAQLVESRLLNL